MTNCLQNLEQERDRIEAILAKDVHWCTFLDVQKQRASGNLRVTVPKEVATALAENDLVIQYLKVVEQINAEKQKPSGADEESSAEQEPELINESVPPARIGPMHSAGPTEAAAAEEPEAEEQTLVEAAKEAVVAAAPIAVAEAMEQLPAEMAVTETIDAVASDQVSDDDEFPRFAATQTFRTRVTVKSSAPAAAPFPGRTVSGNEGEKSSQHGSTGGDDLTLIRRIDRRLAARLGELGVTTYAQIANWNRQQLFQVRDALDLDMRIWRENWIEQAALLHLRLHGTPLDGPQPETLSEDAPEPAAAFFAVAVSASFAEPEEEMGAALVPIEAVERVDVAVQPVRRHKVGQKSKRLPPPAMRRFGYIRGVSAELAEAMRSAGVNSLADIATWTRADVRWFQAMLGDNARITRDQWIEQASMLASGHWTRHALSVVNGETRNLVTLPPPLVAWPPADERCAGADTVAKLQSEPQPLPPVVGDITPQTVSVQADEGSSFAFLAAPGVDPMLHGAVGFKARTKQTKVETSTDAAVEDGNADQPQPALTTRIMLAGKLKRPPPDLGMKWRQAVATEQPASVVMPLVGKSPETTRSLGVTALSPPTWRLMETLDKAQQAERLPDVIFDIASAVEAARQVSKVAETEAAKPVTKELALAPKDDQNGQISDHNGTNGGKKPEPSEGQPQATSGSMDDWDDAEVLIVRRGDINDDQVASEATGFVDDGSPEHDEVLDAGDVLARHGADAPLDRTAADDADANETFSDPVWGDEAEVVIVARPRLDASPEASGVDAVLAASEAQDPPIAPRAAKGTYAAPQRIAERALPAQDLNRSFGSDQAGYRDHVEEATVTIIRAETSETSVGKLLPQEIANDDGAAEVVAERRNVRQLGSRFLKALTGD